MSDTVDNLVVLYHGGGCRDGFCAAWVMRMAYPDAEFHPTNHGQPLPELVGRRVFVVDFCPQVGDLLALVTANVSVTVLDHHATAEAILHEVHRLVNDPERFAFTFAADMSGARLAWGHVCGVTGRHDAGLVPWLVSYVEDRDLWRWALPHSRQVNAAIRLTDLTFEAWDPLAAMDPLSLAERGEAVLLRDAEIVASHVRHARPTRLFGHTVPVVNATVLMSEIGEALSEGQPFAATYFDDLNAGVRRYSLRSRPDGLHVGELAKLITGGGGHKHAAGFQEPLPTA